MLWRTRHGEREAGDLLKFRTGVVVPEEPTAAPKATQPRGEAGRTGRLWSLCTRGPDLRLALTWYKVPLMLQTVRPAQGRRQTCRPTVPLSHRPPE